jgi:hypothetical protein
LAVHSAGADPGAVAAALLLLLLLLLLHLIQEVTIDLAGGGADVSICSSQSQGARNPVSAHALVENLLR